MPLSPSIEFTTTVSSGTYIRTLFEDMAKKWQTFGALNAPWREMAIGPFRAQPEPLPQLQWPATNIRPLAVASSARPTWKPNSPCPRSPSPPRAPSSYGNGHWVDQSMIASSPQHPPPKEGGPCWAMGHRRGTPGHGLSTIYHRGQPSNNSPQSQFSHPGHSAKHTNFNNWPP